MGQASVTAPNPIVVYDMPMMSKFVADFYQQQVKKLKIVAAKTMMSKPGQVKTQQSGKGVPIHPADDRDSDDEAEGKNKMVEIVNEVVEEEKAAAAEISAENKAAQALDKVFAGETSTTSTTETEKSSEQMETENDDE